MRWWMIAPILVIACVGDDPTSTPSTNLPDATSEIDAGADSGKDGSVVNCEQPPRCDGDSLQQCDGRTECKLGCEVVNGEAQCRRLFEPSGPVTIEDLQAPNLGDLTLNGAQINLATGEILQGEQILRQASAPGLKENRNGVLFWRTDEAVVFVAQNITFLGAKPAFVHDDNVNVPLILAASEILQLDTLIELECGKFGGAPASRFQELGAGTGGGRPAPGQRETGATGPGASGATRGGRGGPGGTSSASSTAAVSPAPDSEFVFLGGSAGGGGGDYMGNSLSVSYRGGAGGGALQLLAGRAVNFGSGGIIANGCSGIGTLSGTRDLRVAGAGGGSGGFIWIEAPVVQTSGASRLVANGGAGGSQQREAIATSTDATPTAGAPAAVCSGAGGAGGAGEKLDGEEGGSGPTPIPSACTHGTGGGGGGGSVGRIMVYTRDGNGVQAAQNQPVPIISPTGAAYRRGALTFL